MSLLNLAGIYVYVERAAHPIYEELVARSSKDAEDHPFATMKDLFVLAACIGAERNLFKELGPSRDIFSGETFNARTDVPVLAALAFRRTKDLDTLQDPKKVVQIAECWANGGIEAVRQEIVGRPGLRPLYNLVDMIMERSLILSSDG